VVYFHAIEWKVSPKYVSYALMSAVNDTDNVSNINFEVTSVHVLKQFVLFFNLKEILDGQRKRDLLKGSIDMCKLVNGTIGNFVVKYFLTQVKDKTNFNFKCPVAVNTWYLHNFQAIDDSFIPLWMIGNNIRWEVDIIFKGKVGAMKSMTWFGNVKINGSLSIPT
jgi:Protein of unknown function (DUF1091)